MAKRKHGTGSVKLTASGKWSARTPGEQKSLGTFDTEEQATAALDSWIAGNPIDTSEMSDAAMSKRISAFLDDVEAGNLGGTTVYLGAIGHGLPNVTSEPADVERAIAIVKEQARTGSAVHRLKRQQRVITLQRALAALTETTEDSRAFFVKHAHEWAERNRIGYSAFRMMGVPVDVLTEAGITRTFEP